MLIVLSYLPSRISMFFTTLLTTVFLLPTLSHASPHPQSPSPSPPASSSNTFTDDTAFRESVLSVTNTYRKQHNATGLAWNETLAGTAEAWGEGCKFEHSGGKFGENLASGYENVSSAIVAWGHERREYNFRAGDYSPSTGHFTQLVWKSTTNVGCARQFCNGGQPGGKGTAPGWFLVCEYFPGGNVIGAFQENVQELLPKDKQPQGPSDPAVPVNENSASERRDWRANIWLPIVVACLGSGSLW